MKSIYNSRKERRVLAMVMLVFLVIIIAFGVFSACGVFDVPEWQYTASYPMTNIHINANGM